MTRRRGPWVIVGGAVVVCVGIYVGVLTLGDDSWPERYAQGLREAGEPATWEDVVAPVLDRQENAARDLLPILEELAAPNVAGDLRFGRAWETIDVSMRARVLASLSEHEARFARVRHVLGGRVLRLDSAELRASQLETVDRIDTLQSLICDATQAYVAMPSADAPAHGVLPTIETLARVASAWEPLHPRAFRMAVRLDERTAYAVRNAAAARRIPADAALATFEPLLAPRRVAQWRRVLLVERALSIEVHRGLATRPARGGPQQDGAIDAALSVVDRIGHRRSTLERLSVLDEILALDESDPVRLRDALSRIVAAHPNAVGARPLTASSCRLVLDQAIRADLQREITRIGLAALVQHASSGAWPTSVDPLLPLLDGRLPGTERLRFRVGVQEDGVFVIRAVVPDGFPRVSPWRIPR